MGKHGPKHLFIRVVCTDMYIDRQTGMRCARHQKFRLGRLPRVCREGPRRQRFAGHRVHRIPPGPARYPAGASSALRKVRARAARSCAILR